MFQSGNAPHAILEPHVYHQLEQLVGQLQEPIAQLVEQLLALLAQPVLLDITIGLVVSATPLYKQI